MVTESKAPVELRHAAARNGAISELENAEAKAFALLAAGDYEARLAACGQVIHLADVISDDAVISDDVVIERLAVACLERLIQHLSQIILQFNEVKPDAEMVLQSFSPVGSVKFSRDIKPNLKVAART